MITPLKTSYKSSEHMYTHAVYVDTTNSGYTKSKVTFAGIHIGPLTQGTYLPENYSIRPPAMGERYKWITSFQTVDTTHLQDSHIRLLRVEIAG